MQASHTEYPIFEANQVLTHQQLNAAVNYLEEQERLTRTNLIGIGIVCGLELKLTTNPITLHLSQGCGISSEGYLLVEPQNLALVAYKADYQLPIELSYPSFIDSTTNQQYPLWELFEAGTDDTLSLNHDSSFISDKAVLLFLELKKEDLRNCGPNNCDDKGSRVTVTVRRLLIRLDDLVKLISAAHQLGANLTLNDLEQTLTANLNLTDLRLPRYDIPNTNLATAEQVLFAFQQIFQKSKLVSTTSQALSKLYQTFQSLVQTAYPTDPFTNFATRFGFLETALTSASQVHFLPYYYDFFDDLLQAYKEFCDKGLQLLCACCPAAGLFPRHLILGSLQGNTVHYALRQQFIASAINGECKTQAQEALQLFQRLVGMIEQFTEAPRLPPRTPNNRYDPQIRITPSRFGTDPLSTKAIPYYYLPDQLALLPFWNPEKTRQGKKQQNLSYHADHYNPPPPQFITEPLAYEIEPYNFLRIEGHIGKNYQAVLNNLLRLKKYYRLPIDIIALRAGAFDENLIIDPDKDNCDFQDLNSLYNTLRNELLCFLCKQVEYFYNLPIQGTRLQPESLPIKLSLLAYCSAKKTISRNTLGWLIEATLANQTSQTLPEVDISIPINELNRNNPDFIFSNYFYSYLITYIEKMANELVPNLKNFHFVDFKKRTNYLMQITKELIEFREQSKHLVEGNINLIQWEELGDRLEDILYQCKLAAFTALNEQYTYRLKETKKRQYLTDFLQRHPGIQHKSGTTIGGTFILVYHDKPTPIISNPELLGRPFIFTLNKSLIENLSTVELTALTRVKENVELVENPDIQDLLKLVNRLPRVVSAPTEVSTTSVIEATTVNKIITSTVDAMPDGTVIADFFLPYLCFSECSPITFTLPKPSPYFTYTIQCPNSEGLTEVTLKPEGGLSPYSFKVDDQEYQPLDKSLMLKVGKYNLTIRDAEGTESIVQTLEIAQQLQLADRASDCDQDGNYIATIFIRGGTPPYFVNNEPFNGNSFKAKPLAPDETTTLVITDSNHCSLKVDLKNECCFLPCNGLSRRSAYRLWIQPPTHSTPYKNYQQRSLIKLTFNGKSTELADTQELLQTHASVLNNNFNDIVKTWLNKLNSVIESWLVETFGEAGKNRMLLSYHPNSSDPFGIFYIEHFICDDFSLEFDYAYIKPTVEIAAHIVYLASNNDFNGTMITDRERGHKANIPIFNTLNRNQCINSEYIPTCSMAAGTLKPEAQAFLAEDRTFSIFNGSNGNIEPHTIAAWVWDALDIETTEAVYTEHEINRPALKSAEGKVRLTVITNDGCLGITDTAVQILVL